jgi:hypothetical protein
MADQALDGFDHTQYRDEVIEKWGEDAYRDSDRWWRTMGADEQAAWKAKVAALSAAWTEAATSGISPDSPEAQELASRQAQWLASIPGTPGNVGGEALDEYLLGLGEMYVADPRFAKNYGGLDGATFVRDALRIFVANRTR